MAENINQRKNKDAKGNVKRIQKEHVTNLGKDKSR